MKHLKITMAFLVIMLMIASSLMVISGSEVPVSAAGEPTRAAGENLIIENETFTIDKTSSPDDRSWDNIEIRDDGVLRIIGTLVVAKTIICKTTALNTSFIMENDGSLRAQLTIQEGIASIKADEISLVGASLTVSNSTETLGFGQDGHSSSLTLISDRSDLMINDTTLNIQGQAGAAGGPSDNGGEGGAATLTLEAQGAHIVNISGSEIQVFGGKGGDALAAGWTAGTGGKVDIYATSNHVEVWHSSIHGKSGNAGSASASSIGNTGGSCQIYFTSFTSDLILSHAVIISNTGISSGEEEQARSFVNMKAPIASILWDRSKTEERQSVSSLTSDITYMESNDGAELYQVDVGDSPPQGFAGSAVTLYWWAKVKVVDTTETPMESVSIKYFIQGVGGPFPAVDVITTDENGELWIEVPAYDNGQYGRFTFTANDPGGAEATSDVYRFTSNENLDINIDMDTVGIDPDLSQYYYPQFDKYIIGGDNIEFFGAAASGGLNNIVNRVVIYLGEEVLGEAEDTSPLGSPAFSSWSFTFNTELYPDGDYTFGFQVIDNAYQAIEYELIEINQLIVPHPPEIIEVIITDPAGSRSLPPGGTGETRVNQNDKLINFEVMIFDIDFRSEFLDFGKDMSKANVKLVYVSTGETILTILIEEEDFRKENESGGFSFDFDINSAVKPGTSKALDDGLYRLDFKVYDDANRWSPQNISFDLLFNYIPNAYAYIDELDGSRIQDIIPGTDQFEEYESFILETDESPTIDVRFNLTRSGDQDSPLFGSGLSYQDLTFTVWYRFKGAEGQEITVVEDAEGTPTVEIEFDVGHIPDGEEGSFDLWITVEDEDGLEDNVRYIVRITHNPAPEDPVIFWGIIPGPVMTIVNPILLVLMLIAYGGLLFMFFAKFNKDKKKKLEIVERKREQDKAEKKDTSIDDEISDRYMAHSKSYLEKTGASKGKDEFAKELEAATGKPSGQEAAPDQQAKPPAQPQQQAPAKPPAQQAKPPAQPQQPAPVKPPAQQVKQGPVQGTPQQPPAQAPAAPPKPPAAPPAPPAAPPAPPQVQKKDEK